MVKHHYSYIRWDSREAESGDPQDNTQQKYFAL